MATGLYLLRTANSPRLESKSPASSVAATLLAHAIEPELLGPRPRWVQRFRYGPKSQLRVLRTVCLQLVLLCLSLPLFWYIGTIGVWVGLAIAVVVVASVQWGVGWFRGIAKPAKKAQRLLREGIPTPAILDGLTARSAGLEVSYYFVDRFGEIHRGSAIYPAPIVRRRGLEAGRTFTLLVSPYDAKDNVPFFFVERSRLGYIAATAASANAAKSAANPAPDVCML